MWEGDEEKKMMRRKKVEKNDPMVHCALSNLCLLLFPGGGVMHSMAFAAAWMAPTVRISTRKAEMHIDCIQHVGVDRTGVQIVVVVHASHRTPAPPRT